MCDTEFRSVVKELPANIKDILLQIPINIRLSASEIRMRVGRKICIVYENKLYFLDKILKIEEIMDCFRSICGYSIHSHTQEIKQGFITINGGHRAGISGTAVYDENNNLANLREISSINLRISKQIYGVSNSLINRLNGNVGKLLIIGSPSSGKTTLLKDIIRNLNDRVISIIDTRGEIAACLNGAPQNDIGNADVFDGWNRKDGIISAIKAMSPEIIVCDEIGSDSDLQAINACVGAGVELIATAHGGSLEEIMKRDIIEKILMTGAFDNIVLLKGKSEPCKVESIIKVSDLFARIRNNDFSNVSFSDRFNIFSSFKAKSGANK